METLAIVNRETNELLGSMPRKQAIESGAWCRSTNIFVVNHQDQILCHQRSLSKERFPGVWSTHLGGHVGHDETYESNALKELAEEAGITIDTKQLIMWRTSRIEHQHLWVRDFVVLADKHVDDLVPQPGEVEQFAWHSAKDILTNAQQEPHLWLAGTHDFIVDYHCLKAALSVANANGLISSNFGLDTWHPIRI